MIPRRRVLAVLAAVPLTAASPPISPPAQVSGTTDLVLSCDTALKSATRRAAGSFQRAANVWVVVFPTGPGLLVPQLERAVQNDLLLTQTSIMEAASAAGLVACEPRGRWRNPLVLAARSGADPEALAGRLTVADATPLSDMDGAEIAARLGLAPAELVTVIDTDTVRTLLRRGEVDVGLLHVSDVVGQTDLEALRIIPDDVAPALIYVIAVTCLARRPEPQAFVDFLVSPEGSALMKEYGLERIV